MLAAVKRATDTARKRDLAMFADGREHGKRLPEIRRPTPRAASFHIAGAGGRTPDRERATVLWAVDAAESRHVQEIAAHHNVRRVTKSKSMISEESA